MTSLRVIGDDFVESLDQSWRDYGLDAIEAVREIDPAAYIRLVAAVCRGAAGGPDPDLLDIIRWLIE